MPMEKGPLDGVRVIDLTTVVMGPSATQYMGDLGADVIKVESPGGDSMRKIGPGSDQNMGAIFLGLNRNKRSVVLDLKQAVGKAAFLRLAERADVIATNVRPAAMSRLGLSYREVCEKNSRIIYASLVGFSQRGPYAPSPAFDDLIQAAAGVPHAMALASDGTPRYAPMNIVDRSVGLYAFGVISTALYARERTGCGQHVEIPMFESMVPTILGDHMYGQKFIPPRGPSGYPRILARTRQLHRTKDGFVSCTIYSDHHWRAFLDIIGHPEWMESDARLRDIDTRVSQAEGLELLVRDEFGKRTTAEWATLLGRADIPVFPMQSFDSLLEDPHLAEIGFFREEACNGLGTIRETAVPSEWSGTPPGGYRSPPQLGAHTQEVLSEIGMSALEIGQVLQQRCVD